VCFCASYPSRVTRFAFGDAGNAFVHVKLARTPHSGYEEFIETQLSPSRDCFPVVFITYRLIQLTEQYDRYRTRTCSRSSLKQCLCILTYTYIKYCAPCVHIPGGRSRRYRPRGGVFVRLFFHAPRYSVVMYY